MAQIARRSGAIEGPAQPLVDLCVAPRAEPARRIDALGHIVRAHAKIAARVVVLVVARRRIAIIIPGLTVIIVAGWSVVVIVIPRLAIVVIARLIVVVPRSSKPTATPSGVNTIWSFGSLVSSYG